MKSRPLEPTGDPPVGARVPRTGAEALVLASARAGIEVCFANPGTTEMSIVAALGDVGSIRSVPVLFEGVASGAADGYARLTGRPAAVLLHLGPGLANATANLHNARRAVTPVVAWVGEHTTWIDPLDPPLASDIASIAKGTARWIQRIARVADVTPYAHAAVAAAAGPPGGVATLLLPDDLQKAPWSVPPVGGAVASSPEPVPVERSHVEAVARRVRTARSPLLLLGGVAVETAGLAAAARIAAAASVTLLVEQFPRCLRRDSQLPRPGRVHYLPSMARAQLAEHDVVVLAGADRPVCFFGYDGEAPELVADSTVVLELAPASSDPRDALGALADALDARDTCAPVAALERPALPQGRLSPDAMAAAVAALLPDDSIVVDEAITSSPALYTGLERAPAHDYLSCKGGAIGWAIPAATGAAIAAPGRRVVTVVGDGSAAYTVQALWTQAREGLDVTTVVVVNHRYAILQLELMRAQHALEGPGETLTRIDAPSMDYCALARGFGVDSRRVATAEELGLALRESFEAGGPMVIEAILG